MMSDVIYQSSKPSSMLSFHCCSESSHLLSFPARPLLHPHSLFALQGENKKNMQNINIIINNIIQLVYDKLMWGSNIQLKYLNYSCSKQGTTDLRHQNKILGKWYYLKYYYVPILISRNLLIWSIQIMEGGFINKKVLTEKDKNRECLRTCNHERRQTKLIRWINSLPTETFKKNWAIYFGQKIGKLANIMFNIEKYLKFVKY